MLGLLLFAQLALAASPGVDCTPPKFRDAQPLRKAVQEDGNLSIALDAVATACFDAQGEWSAGWPSGRKPTKGGIAPECRKALFTCELANSARVRSGPVHQLDGVARADLERPFGGAQYRLTLPIPALVEGPAEAVNCKAQNRAELFTQAQRRSELAKLHASTLSEYARYRAWVEKERGRCREGVGISTTRLESERVGSPAGPGARAWSDQSKNAGPMIGSMEDGGSDHSTSIDPIIGSGVDPPSPERRIALSGSLLDKWRYFATEAQKTQADPEVREYFPLSQEAQACRCTRPDAAVLARAIEKKEGGEAGLALITADDPENSRCAECFLDAQSAWKGRVAAQCTRMGAHSEYELNRLEQSNEGSSIPQRCFDDARQVRAASQKLLAPVAGRAAAIDAGAPSSPMAVGPKLNVPDAGTRLASVVGVGPAPLTVDGGSRPAGLASGRAESGGKPAGTPGAESGGKPAGTPGAESGGKPAGTPGLDSGGKPAGTAVTASGGTLTTIDGMTYYRPPDAGAVQVSAPPAAYRPAAVASTRVPASLYDAFVPPQSYAPIPAREEGRFYLRLSMSAACVAELTPGPIHARTGDLILVPFTAKSMEVKSPCGGVAEIYYGKEPTPRFSEVFGRNQPVSFVFRPQ